MELKFSWMAMHRYDHRLQGDAPFMNIHEQLSVVYSGFVFCLKNSLELSSAPSRMCIPSLPSTAFSKEEKLSLQYLLFCYSPYGNLSRFPTLLHGPYSLAHTLMNVRAEE